MSDQVYWLVNSGTSADPYRPGNDDWRARFAAWEAERGPVHMFSRRPTIVAGDRLVHHAVGSGRAYGAGRIFALAEVVADPEPSGHERWPWQVLREVVAGAVHLRSAPTLADIDVHPASLRQQSHIRLTPEQGRRAEWLLGWAAERAE